MKNELFLTDEELVKLYADGNNNAFETLLNRYKSRVYSYIYFIVRNKDICEDVFQETFIKAITTIKQGRYVESGKFLGWINRIAHNLIIDYFRRAQNENTSSSDNADFDVFNTTHLSDKNIEDYMVREQVMCDVARLVDFLPNTQQEVIRMRYYEDLSFKEIAEKTGVSINTALGRMRYAVLNMRRIAEENNMQLELN
ncbi:MAG: sigma-70 family RNA polymerase sigma factor [Paludibacteraceae bacterium]|nr:sigma-70 family RNA polymerase sigma factor [Paludibacteraceae bacterium]MBN2787618.1 sigma-70 family RNA polymerase sigma factor [Paludibacteraceae bacterium]